MSSSPVKMKVSAILYTTTIVLSVILLTLPLSSCSRGSSKGTPFRIIEIGDPNKVLEGAKTNSEFNLEYFRHVSAVRLRSSTSFVQRVKLKKVLDDMDEIQRAAAPKKQADEVIEDKESVYKVVRTFNNDAIEKVMLISGDYSLSFSNEMKDGKKHVVFRHKANPEIYIEQLVHFSVSENKDMFSVLAVGEGEMGKQLNAYYFSKDLKVAQHTFIEKFYYLLGPGVKFAWSKQNPVSISACGKNMQHYEAALKMAIQSWNETLESLLTIQEQAAAEFYPFSDLNQRCVYRVSDYAYTGDDGIKAAGIALDVGYNSEIIDGDIFVFRNEKDEVDEEFVSNLNQTVLHEMGHWLGLDHQFDKDKPSIMGYDFSVTKIQDYDRDAIRALYK